MSTQKTYTWIFLSLFVIAKIWKQPICPSVVGQMNCGTSKQSNIIQCYKEMSSQTMERLWGSLNAHY
jgi:hypothetical protein